MNFRGELRRGSRSHGAREGTDEFHHEPGLKQLVEGVWTHILAFGQHFLTSLHAFARPGSAKYLELRENGCDLIIYKSQAGRPCGPRARQTGRC